MGIRRSVFSGLANESRSPLRSRWWVIGLIVCVLSGCASSTKQKWLNVFFDGVPVPGIQQPTSPKASSPSPEEPANPGGPAPETASAPEKELKKNEPVLFRHPPYAENACDICHESKFSQKLSVEPPELCFSCHDDFLKGAKTKHYPAEAGMCTACHNPHKSENKFLLVQPQPELCFQCHDKQDVMSKEVHVVIEGEICTNCHNPHAE